MAESLKFRKKPVEVEAVRWTGENTNEVLDFTGDAYFDPIPEENRGDLSDPDATAAVFDKLHSTWVLLYNGDWVIRGVQGELYPCRADVFEATYEPVEVGTDG
jgi:hypothetical protein